ncbi:MAG: hypothetical protein WB425_11705 [Terracidiphilus sp.]
MKSLIRSVLNQRVTRSVFGDAGPLFDPEHRWTNVQTTGSPYLGKKTASSLEIGFAGAFGQNAIDRKPVGYTIAHRLQCTLCLLRFARIECQSKLAESIRREMEFAIERFPNPSAAIVGAKNMILDNNDAEVRLLYHQLAIGDQDREVHDRCLRPMLKAFSNRLCMRLIDEVELAVLRRTACTNQFVLHSTKRELCHAVLDHRLLVWCQLRRYTHARYSDAGIELREELSLERVLPAQFAGLAGHFSSHIDLQLKNELGFNCRVLWPCRCHLFSSLVWRAS